MSKKLPIGETVNEAFQFGVEHWFTVTRLAWLPGLLIGLLYLGIFGFVIDFSVYMDAVVAPEASSNLSLDDMLKLPLAYVVLLYVAFGLAALLLFSGVMASIYRLAALGEQRNRWIDLRLDGPAWNVFWAQIIVVALNVGLYIAAFCVAALALGYTPLEGVASFKEIFAAAANDNPDYYAANGELTEFPDALKIFLYAHAAAVLPVIYVNVKLIPFLPAAAVENRLPLFRAFAVSFGSFWSMIGIYVVMAVLLIVAIIAAEIVLGLIGLVIAAVAGLAGPYVALIAIVVYGVLAAIVFYSFVGAVQISLRGIIYRRLTAEA